MPVPRPKIDAQYWFNYSESLVSANSERIDQAAERLQAMTLWLWGIYTTLASVGFALAQKRLPSYMAWLIAIASLLLLALYWCAVWMRIPERVSFDPRSPDQIKNAYASACNSRYVRLKITIVVSALAVLAVSASLIVSSFAGQQPESKDPDLKAIVNSDGRRSSVSVTAHVGKTEAVVIVIKTTDGRDMNVPPVRILPSDGLVQTCIELPEKSAAVRVHVQWKVDDTDWQLAKNVAAAGSRPTK